MVEFDKNIEYCTNDLYFAAFLVAAELKKIRCVNCDNKFYFIFDNQMKTIQNLERDYFSYKTKICPLKYKHALKDLRTEMFLKRSQ